jgi:hypothetical protein
MVCALSVFAVCQIARSHMQHIFHFSSVPTTSSRMIDANQLFLSSYPLMMASTRPTFLRRPPCSTYSTSPDDGQKISSSLYDVPWSPHFLSLAHQSLNPCYSSQISIRKSPSVMETNFNDFNYSSAPRREDSLHQFLCELKTTSMRKLSNGNF